MGYVITKQNTSLKIAHTKSGFLTMTNLQLFVQAINATTILIGNSASANLHFQCQLSEIDSIGGSARAGTMDGVFNQIAALLN